MTMQPEGNAAEAEGLQFDQAVYDDAGATATALACAACRQPIAHQYYEINGATLCEGCRGQIEGQLRGGSGFLRLLKAILLGTGAMVVSAGIYFAVLHFLNLEAALASILCGFLIGKAVRMGSDNRGGWIYQILAVGLTYLAIGLAYSGEALAQGIFDGEVAKMAANDPQMAQVGPGATIAIKAVLFTISAVMAPVLISTSNVISAVIVLFALWEAWKFTKKVKLIVTGPYRVGEAAPGLVEPEALDHA